MAYARPNRAAKSLADLILGRNSVPQGATYRPPSISGAAAATQHGTVKPSLCTVCRGSGDEWRCPGCNGKGTTVSYDPNFPWVLCRKCGGHNSKIACGTCLGAGRV
jgi:hypothetical protein